MTTCNNIILSQPNEGSVLNHEIPSDVSARLNFGPDDISGLRIGDAGQLVISFVDGGQLNITNFDDVVENGNLLYLEDGTLIDPTILTGALKSPQDFNNIETAAGAASNADAIRIGQPAANTTQEISMQEGQKYVCDFDPANAATVELKDGQMVLTFADGSQVVINNYAQAMAGDLPAELTVADGTVVEPEAQLTEVTEVQAIEEILEFAEAEAPAEVEETVVAQQTAPVENIAEQLNNIEAAAGDDIAQTLAQIEPAAGEVGGATGNTGYGFNSTATDVPLNSPLAIGPLGATQLAYNAPQFQQQQFIRDDAPSMGANRVDLDETNLSAGALVGEGRVNVDFGGDAFGATIIPNGTFTATCNVAGEALSTGGFQLSSGGVDVDVTATENGYVGTANGEPVFTLELNSGTGEYTYTQVRPFDHSDTNDTNEAICLDFGVVAIDGDGDRATTTIRVNVLDDAPVVTSQVAGEVDETSFDDANNEGRIAKGTFEADAGEDESATYTVNGNFSYMGSVDNGVLTSNGVPVEVTFDAATNTYTGVAGTVTVFTLVLGGAGADANDYVYTQLAPLDHADASNPDDVINLKFGVDVTDFDGDSASGEILINVRDDAPVTGDDTNTIDEDNLANGPIVINDNVSVDFGEDGEGSLEPAGEDTFSANGSIDNGVLSSGGEAITVTATDDGYVGTTADGTVIFELEITDPSTGAYTFTQYGPLDHADDSDANDTIELNFGTVITDFDGDSEPGNIQIIIADSAPVFQKDGIVPDNATQTVDETTDGNLVASGQLEADFGGDANGTYVGDGAYEGVALTSCGHAVTVTFDADTNTYTGATASETIFTLEINAETGEYTYTQIGSLDHPDAQNDNEALALEFGVDAVDSEGEAAKGAIVINVLDDAPEAQNVVAGSTDETSGENKTLSGALTNVDFGRDGEGSIAGNDEFTSGGSRTGNALTSGGEPVTVSFDAATGTYTGTAGNDVVFTMTITETGEYNFELVGILDHADGNDDNDVINLNFGYDLIDCDGDHDKAYITVRVVDDAPTAAFSVFAVATEADLDGVNPLVVEGQMDFSYGNDGAGSIKPSGFFTTKFVLGGPEETLTVDGEAVEVNVDGNIYTATVNGELVFTLEIDPATGEFKHTQYMAVDHPAAGADVMWLVFGVTITDADGDSVNQFINIDLVDDVPVAVDDVNAATEGGVITGSVLTNDDAGSDGLGAVTKVTVNGQDTTVPENGSVDVTGVYGVLTINSDGTYSYKANNDNPDGVDEFSYMMRDRDGDMSTAELRITVTSIDDVPVIVPQNGTVDETDLDNGNNVVTGTVNVDFGHDLPGEVNPNGDFTTSIGDTIQSCGEDVVVTLAGNTYTGVAHGDVIFTMEVLEDGSFTFTQIGTIDHPNDLDDNDNVVLNFGVTATDADGDTASTTININVLDDGPDIENIAQAVDEDVLANGNLVANGTVPHDFGQDGAGSITMNGLFEAKFQRDGSNVTLSSGGSAITVTNTDGVYTGRTADGAVAFTLEINSDTGAYTYTQVQPLDHPDDTNPDDVIWLKFYVDIEDKDGDTDTGVIVIDVHDDGPVAKDDKLTVEENDTATGNVLTNDDIGVDTNGEVTTVTFEGQDYDLVNGTVTVQGNGGTLTMNSDGSYEYSAVNGAATQTVRSFEVSDFVQNAAIGEITEVSGALNETTEEFTFSFTIEGSEANGATLVLNDGPNPKGFAGELPQFYIDNSTGTPIVTAYGYNGLGGVPGTTDSAFDGSQEAGIQTPDRIATSLDANSPFSNISVVTNADGSQTFTFSVDTAVINDYAPINSATGAEWQGIDFTDTVGAWFHPVSGLETNYNADGYLTQFDFDGRGGWDSNNVPTNTSTITGDDVFSYTVVDADGDSSTADLHVCVDADPAPTGIYGENATDDTIVRTDGTDMVTGDITVNYNGDGEGETSGNGVFLTTPTNQTNGVLSHNGTPIEVKFDANTNTYTGFAGTLPVFTMVINSDATYKFTQLESLDHGNTASRNETMFLQFGVTATDADGDEGTGLVQIRVRDDWSDARNDTATTDEGGTVTGNVIANDVLSADETSYVTNVTVGGVNYAVNPNTTTPTVIVTPNGELTIDRTGAYTYEANDDADGVDNFVYTLTDGDGDTDTATLKVTVNNVNDVPTIETSVTGVNEVDLCDHPLVVNKTFVHDFGNDGAGKIEVNGDTVVKFKVGGQDQTLEANGVPIVISQSGNGYVGKAGNLTVFTMTLNANTGEYTYTQFAGVDHPGVGKAGTDDVIWLKLGVTITDSDGDSADAYVNIDIRDTAPEAVNDTNSVAEGEKETGNVLTNDVNCEDGSQVCEVVFGNQTIAVPATGSVNVNGQYGVLTIKSDGSYSYTANSNNPDGVDVFTYTMKDQDGDTSSANLSITVTSVDGVPTIEKFVKGVNESDLCEDDLVVKGTLTHDFGVDGAGKIEPNGVITTKFKVGGNAQTLTSSGKEVIFTTTADGYIGKAGGETVLTLTVDPATGEFTYTQLASVDHPGVGATGTDDVIWLQLGVKITDNDGDVANSYVNIDIRDDAPVASNDKVFVGGSASIETFALDLTSSDVAGHSSSFTRDGITVKSNTGGDLTWVSNSDGAGTGIAGNGSDKVFRTQEILEVNFATVVTAATFTLADMGANNIGDSFKYEVFLADGSSVNETITIDAGHVNNGMIEFDVSGYAQGITGVDLIGGPSFVLNNVEASAVDYTAGDAQGNVLLNDHPACGDETVVTTISFEGRDYSVPANGSNRTIAGDNGTLTINAKGEYTYVSNTSPAQTVYSFNQNHPGGSDNAGNIENVSGAYNATTNELDFSFVIDGTDANGFTLVMNDGPNPKNHPGEMAMFYFDASKGGEPVVSVYAYNGGNDQTSYRDGSSASGTQTPDRILGSNDANNPFTNIKVSVNGNGDKVFTFSMDATDVIEHNPAYTSADADWTGTSFDNNLGIWFHPVSGLETEYDAQGNLTNWHIDNQSWWDASNLSAEVTTIPGQTGGDDTFTYTIRDEDGDTSTATLEICVKDFDNVIEISENGNYFGTDDGDLFLFKALGEAGAARLSNFSLEEDALDIGNVVQGFDPLTDAINDFVYVTENNGDTVVQIDADGIAGGARENVARLDNVTGESLEDLIENGNIIL